MEDRFNLLVVDETTIDNHAGEEYDLYREVISSPGVSMLDDYALFFRGIIRSAWHDVSKNIVITCDASNDYKHIFETLLAVMETEEGITFSLR